MILSENRPEVQYKGALKAGLWWQHLNRVTDYLIILTWIHIASQLLEKYLGLQNVKVDCTVVMQCEIHRGFVVETTETEFLSEQIASDFLESYNLVAFNETINALPAFWDSGPFLKVTRLIKDFQLFNYNFLGLQGCQPMWYLCSQHVWRKGLPFASVPLLLRNPDAQRESGELTWNWELIEISECRYGSRWPSKDFLEPSCTTLC